MAKKFNNRIISKTSGGKKAYYLDLQIDGKRKNQKAHDGFCACRTIKCQHYQAAEKALQDYEARLAEKKKSGISDGEFETVREKYEKAKGAPGKNQESANRAKLTLKIFSSFLKTKKVRLLSEIDYELLQAFQLSLLNGECTLKKVRNDEGELVNKPATEGGVNVHMRTLSGFFSHAVKIKELEENPFTGHRTDLLFTPTPKTNWLKKEEIQKILDNTTGLNRDLFVFLLNTGCRSGEARNLKWDMVHDNSFELPVRRAWKPKGKKTRTIPINEAVKQVLKNRRKVSGDSPYVFTTATGTQLDKDNVVKHFTRIFKKLGIVGHIPSESITAHSIRDTFATILINEKGVPVATVSSLLGHSTIAQTQKYCHTSEEHEIAAVAKLNF